MSARLARATRGLAFTVTAVALAASTMAPAVADEQRREVYVGPASDDSVASPLPVRATVVDKKLDARGTRLLRPFADLRRVSYRTPSTREGGTMTVRVRWRDLIPTGRGVRQSVTTLVDLRTDKSEDFYYVTTSGAPPFSLYVITDDDGADARYIRPEDLDVRLQPGRDRTVVTMSTEWLPPTGTVRLYTNSDAEGRELNTAWDGVRPRNLRVGPAPAAD